MTVALSKSITKRFTNHGEKFGLTKTRLVELDSYNDKDYVQNAVRLSDLKDDVETARASDIKIVDSTFAKCGWTVEFIKGNLWVGCKNFTRDNTAIIMKALGFKAAKKAAKKRAKKATAKRARSRTRS